MRPRCSSTFWVAPPSGKPVPDALHAGAEATAEYVDLKLNIAGMHVTLFSFNGLTVRIGPVKTADLEFAGFTIHDQSFSAPFIQPFQK